MIIVQQICLHIYLWFFGLYSILLPYKRSFIRKITAIHYNILHDKNHQSTFIQSVDIFVCVSLCVWIGGQNWSTPLFWGFFDRYIQKSSDPLVSDLETEDSWIDEYSFHLQQNQKWKPTNYAFLSKIRFLLLGGAFPHKFNYFDTY